MFHTLAASNAELIAGQRSLPCRPTPGSVCYRRLDHGRAQNNLRGVVNQLSPPGESFARTFIDLQGVRQQADYDPNFSITDAITSTG